MFVLKLRFKTRNTGTGANGGFYTFKNNNNRGSYWKRPPDFTKAFRGRRPRSSSPLLPAGPGRGCHGRGGRQGKAGEGSLSSAAGSSTQPKRSRGGAQQPGRAPRDRAGGSCWYPLVTGLLLRAAASVWFFNGCNPPFPKCRPPLFALFPTRGNPHGTKRKPQPAPALGRIFGGSRWGAVRPARPLAPLPPQPLGGAVPSPSPAPAAPARPPPRGLRGAARGQPRGRPAQRPAPSRPAPAAELRGPGGGSLGDASCPPVPTSLGASFPPPGWGRFCSVCRGCAALVAAALKLRQFWRGRNGNLVPWGRPQKGPAVPAQGPNPAQVWVQGRGNASHQPQFGSAGKRGKSRARNYAPALLFLAVGLPQPAPAPLCAPSGLPVAPQLSSAQLSLLSALRQAHVPHLPGEDIRHGPHG